MIYKGFFIPKHMVMLKKSDYTKCWGGGRPPCLRECKVMGPLEDHLAKLTTQRFDSHVVLSPSDFILELLLYGRTKRYSQKHSQQPCL